MYLRARDYGISYLPQEPSIFRKLTVEENILAVLETLHITWEARRKRAGKPDGAIAPGACAQEPRLCAERRRAQASGNCPLPGDQSAFILLDEPFSGIDPIAVLDLQTIIFDLKASGIGVLITDHNVRETLRLPIAPTSSMRAVFSRREPRRTGPRSGSEAGLSGR